MGFFVGTFSPLALGKPCCLRCGQLQKVFLGPQTPSAPPALRTCRVTVECSHGRLVGLGAGGGGPWETKIICSCTLWEAHLFFFGFCLRTLFHIRVLGWGAAGFLGSDVDIPTSRNPAILLGGREFWKSPHLSSPGKAISRRESWPHVQPRAPTPASPRLPPCSNWPTPGVLMWGTQALSKVCLHLACFAAVAHWGGDRPCDVRNVNGSQVCIACLPPARLPRWPPSRVIHLSGGWASSSLPLTIPSLCLLPLSTPFSDSLSPSPLPSLRGHSAETGFPAISGWTERASTLISTLGCHFRPRVLHSSEEVAWGIGRRTWSWPSVFFPSPDWPHPGHLISLEPGLAQPWPSLPGATVTLPALWADKHAWARRPWCLTGRAGP